MVLTVLTVGLFFIFGRLLSCFNINFDHAFPCMVYPETAFISSLFACYSYTFMKLFSNVMNTFSG